MKRFLKREKGQSMVEFALTLPIAVLILFAIADFGWIFMHEITITNAAREGARIGIVYATDADYANQVSARVKSTAGVTDSDDLVVSVTKKSVANGTDIVVEVQYPVPVLTPLGVALLGGQTFTVDKTCTMKI